MATTEFILDLGKLVISAAWADGELANEEVNVLKRLLFRLGEVTAEDWAVLAMYMESPTGKAEQEELLARVLGSIRTREDKALAVATLEEVFRSDGTVTAEEEALLRELKGEIGQVGTGVFAGLAKALKSAIGQQQAATSSLREHASEDYLNNRVYYELMRRQQESGGRFDQSEPQVRKLCLATGLLFRVAGTDGTVSHEERAAMVGVLAGDWSLSAEQAEALVGIGCGLVVKGLDEFRLALGYFECTTFEERRQFLHTLFRIASSAGHTSHEEIEEIRHIAASLKLPHRDFIAAKVAILREEGRMPGSPQ